VRNHTIPGIRVTVYFPPYFVGLKISDWTVAMAAMRVRKKGQPEKKTKTGEMEDRVKSIHLAQVKDRGPLEDTANALRRRDYETR
jgi:hypothetical protein